LDHATGQPGTITPEQIENLIAALISDGFQVIGPTVRDGAITYEPVESIADLPSGWTDEQEPGRYRLKKTDSPAFFGYSLAAQSWKPYFHPSEVRLLAAEKQNGAFHILNNDPAPMVPRVFLGVRACELAAIKALDRVLLGDRYRDPIYAARRGNVFIIAVQCSRAAETCFCASLGSGPKVSEGYDLLLTEFADEKGHRFVIEAGSDHGSAVLTKLKAAPTSKADLDAIQAGVDFAAQQHRKIDTAGLKEFLYENFENPHWDKIAARCLNCANCTMACPTCFCTTVDDTTDVTGNHAERWRRWDSCFTQSFSYIHGGSIRTSGKARYRQWMTHKLAAWTDQFGSSGCVGCGRCITWCPAAIDITEEVRAMREGGVRADT
jgi:formate hydrogenlyase subunit 6/NADH:ubiquinone oxidoreductase subunit I